MKKHILSKLLLLLCIIHTTTVFSQNGPEARERVGEWDKQNLRHASGVVTDNSEDFIKIPKGYPGTIDFTVAKTAPVIDFMPVRGLSPEFFPEDNKGKWSHWGDIVQGPNGCFYMATGDHRAKDSQVFITEYDPVKKEQRIVVDVGKTCGWKKGLYTDGKIHGTMNIMPDGTLVAATWLGRDVNEEDIAHGWLGSYVLTYNVFTGEAENHGIPMLNYGWHHHVTDIQTGVLLAIGDGYAHGTALLAYDVINRKTIFAGMPPDGISINMRASLLDPRTGMLYSTDNTRNNAIFSYNYRTNRFRHLECKVPPHPVTGKDNILRAYTKHRTPDNAFYCMDQGGGMFKFYPDEERTESLNMVNFDSEGMYVTTTMTLSPKCRYIHFVPGPGHGIYELGTPVVQFDTKTKQNKVIAFIGAYYHKKYGYANCGSYGAALSNDGSSLVISMNGGWGPDIDKEYYDQTSIYVVHIPESERIE